MTWQDRAACHGLDTESFYPDPTNAEGIATALSYCHRCPVIEQCLAYAMSRRDANGIWGGTTETQRRTMLRKVGIANRKARK